MPFDGWVLSELEKQPEIDPGLKRHAAMRLIRDADLIVRARQDPNVFVEICGRIEGGKWLSGQAPVHRMWQDFLTASGKVARASTACLLAPVGFAKSTQVHRWRVIWELGRNPNLRIALIGETQLLPSKMLRGIVADIETNPFVQAVFPHLRRSKKPGQDKWNEEEIYVERESNLPDASIRVYSVNSPVLGSRFDLMVFDDVVSIENTLTSYMRRKVWDTVRAQFLSRRPPTELGSSRVWFLGHVWYEDDTIAEACRLPGASVLRQGARVQRLPDETLREDLRSEEREAQKEERRKKRGKIITSADEEWDESLGWVPLAPMLVDKEELGKKYVELGWGAGHMLDNRFIRKSGTGFSEELLFNALRAGAGLPFTGDENNGQNTWNPIATGAETYTGVDLSTGEGDDETVLFTVALLPGGTRRVLCIESGKWDGPEIRDRIIANYKRYQPTIAVECNGAQRMIRQFVNEAHVVSVTDHETTGQAKHHLKWGIRQMALELADPCRWQFPRPMEATRRADPQIRKLLYDAIHYSPERHPGDHLMAWWICWLQIVKATGEWSK